MKKNNLMCEFDEVTIIDLSVIDSFIKLYGIYLNQKNVYDSYVKKVNSHFSVNPKNDIVAEIYLKILQINNDNVTRVLQNDIEGRNEANIEVNELKRLSSDIKKYKKILEMFKISDEDTFSKFVKNKSIAEIENDVRSKCKDSGEIDIMTKVNSIYFSQDEVSTTKIIDIYGDFISVKKYMEIIKVYEEKLKNANFFTYRIIKYKLNKKLRDELKNDKNEKFSSLLNKQGDIFTLVIDEVKKYTKYLSALSKFNESMYSDVMVALDDIEKEPEEMQISDNVTVLTNSENKNYNAQKLRDLYQSYGVDEFYLESASSLFQMNYSEAFVKLRFCDDYYQYKYNCNAAGSEFQIEVLFMNDIELNAKFGIGIRDLFEKYGKIDSNIDDINKTDTCYKKAI